MKNGNGRARLLTKLLRHKAPEHMSVDNKGFVDTKVAMDWVNDNYHGKTGQPLTMKSLEQVVLDDNKGRFQWNEDKSKIRAVQGHSFTVKVEYEPYTVTGVPLHFTYIKCQDSIEEQGLLPMSRQYIHMVEYREDVSPWHLVRKNSNMIVSIKPECIPLLKFYMSDNGVLLCDAENGINPDMLIYLPLEQSSCAGFIVQKEDDFLLVKTPHGHLSYPKGKRHKGENSFACAYRELEEETGLTARDIILTGGCSRELGKNGKTSILYYHANLQLCHSGICVPEDPDELEECLWMSRKQINDSPDMLEKRKLLLAS